MSEQTTFASAAWASKGKITRRERFLAEMQAVIPWSRFETWIAPHFPTAGRGRRPYPLPVMLRIYFLQQWFRLSDPMAEESLYDSEAMRQTRKGNQWYFGMKAHIGTDTKGIVHTLVTTDAAVADITQLDQLLRGTESAIYGDQAYDSVENEADFVAAGVRYRIQKRGKQTARKQHNNRVRSRVRSMVKHPFHVVKQLWGFTKVRYRGLAKNTAQLYTLFALANLYRVRYRLRPDLVPAT